MTPKQLNAAVERQLELRREQGFPRHLEDEAILAKIADLIRHAKPKRDSAA